MRVVMWALAGLATIVLVFGGVVFSMAYRLEVEQFSDDLFVLYGAGGNVGVLGTVGTLAREAVAAGTPRDQFLAAAALTADSGYTELRMLVSLGLDREFVLGRAFDEATGDAGSAR